MEPKRLNQNSQMDLQEVMKKVVSLENTLVSQAKEIELQSNEIKSLKHMLSRNISTHQQYRQPAIGQENLQHHHHHHGVVQNSGVPTITIKQPKRYSREFLNNVRYSTGAANFSSYTMNPLVHPSTAIPPINTPQPMAGIINMHPPPQSTLMTNNNNNNSKSDANHNSFKLKPSRLHVAGNSLQPSLPVTSNGRFEPSISVKGFRSDEIGDADLFTRKEDIAAHHKQSFVENSHNNVINNAATDCSTASIPASSSFWKNSKKVLTKGISPNTKTIESKVVEPKEQDIQQAAEKQTLANDGVDSAVDDLLPMRMRLDLRPRENDNPCRCPTLYSINRRGRAKTDTLSNLDDGDDEYSIDELTSEEQEEEKPFDKHLYLPNPRAEKARLIIPKRDERTKNYRFKFINKADELEETNDLAESCLSISGWPSLKSTSAAHFLSSTSPKKKALKLDLSSKFTIQDFINNQTLS